jgi:hypothetical protein
MEIIKTIDDTGPPPRAPPAGTGQRTRTVLRRLLGRAEPFDLLLVVERLRRAVSGPAVQVRVLGLRAQQVGTAAQHQLRRPGRVRGLLRRAEGWQGTSDGDDVDGE